MLEVLKSQEDASVNFVSRTPDGIFESRFVQRDAADYMICYLSSHSGCDRACRFCHLTQTGQTGMVEATVGNLVDQAVRVIDHYRERCNRGHKARHINFNFMARGEPLESQVLWSKWREISATLTSLAENKVMTSSFNISTIMPESLGGQNSFCLYYPFNLGTPNVTFYYSLYSMREEFRKRWLPKAMDPRLALAKLREFQEDTERDVVLHWSFIEGENDDLDTLDEIIEAVHRSGLKPRFNLVRYNPYSERQGRESSFEIIERNFEYLSQAFGNPNSRIVPRVGYSARCSCGMFADELGGR